MRTFWEWLEATFGQTIKLHGYNHYMCNKCGRTLGDDWVKEMGLNCPCGGKLAVADPDSLSQNDQLPYYQNLRFKPRALRGSAK